MRNRSFSVQRASVWAEKLLGRCSLGEALQLGGGLCGDPMGWVQSSWLGHLPHEERFQHFGLENKTKKLLKGDMIESAILTQC